jgi:adenylyltransferase/sulfurtransferase
MLEKEELKRYNRQIILPELGMDGQQKLKQARVLIVGAGGLGCPVLQYLVAAGIGVIGIVDDDLVDISNLHRQILYNINDIGFNKAEVAKEKLQLLNPHVRIISHPERLTEHNSFFIFSGYDLVIDGSDNFPTRYLVNDTCVALNKPLVFGSIFKFEGQVSVFNYQSDPNYRDLFPEAPTGGEVPNCADIGVIGVLPGIVGTFMANEVIKIICGIGDVLSGKLLTINALDVSVSLFKFGDVSNQPRSKIVPLHAKHSIQEIDFTELERWNSAMPEQIILVDVREFYEFEDFNIGGINIPLYELTDRVTEIPEDKKVIFCCSTGVRSKQAIVLFMQTTNRESIHLKNGFKNYGNHAKL